MLVVLVLPPLIALVPVVARTLRSTFVSAALLSLVTVLGMASIGIFLIPTVALAWVAASASMRFDVSEQPHRTRAR